MDKKTALDACRRAMEASSADQTEVLLIAGNNALTRFANNHIHQNVASSGASVQVRAVIGKRIGVAGGNDLSPEALADTARRACEIARLAQPNEEFISLPGPEPIGFTAEATPATLAFGPMERAEAVRTVIATAEGASQVASGAFSVSGAARAIANSLGVEAYETSSGAQLRMVLTGDDSSGYAQMTSADVVDIDAAALAAVASEKCSLSAGPREVEPGAYDVILEADAVADMVFFLIWTAFGAMSMQEGRSPLAGRLGQKVCGENITIFDDGSDPRTDVSGTDYEGVPKQRLNLISNGVAEDIAYDSFTAGREQGRRSTGHALPAPNSIGPLPINVVVQPGDATVEKMIASTNRGLLVTRFHYTNILQPKQSIFTGMTRDGTFLIEDGRIVGGVRNLRFTQSILEALSNVEMISEDGKRDDYVWAPAMKIRGFNFSGKTEF